jgi:hypothetical protein
MLSTMAEKPVLKKPLENVVPIAKPRAFDLDKFKSKRAAAVANVETLQTGLPHHNISQAKDFVRLVISDVRKAPGHPPSVIALARARTRTSISPEILTPRPWPLESGRRT